MKSMWRFYQDLLFSSDANSDLTTRAYRKGIINLRDDNRFEPADFHARFDKWAMFEGWKDIPDEIRNQLNAWEFAHYGRQHADQITKLGTVVGSHLKY